jgi:hypothetical protein
MNTFKVNTEWSDLEVTGEETEFGIIGRESRVSDSELEEVRRGEERRKVR